MNVHVFQKSRLAAGGKPSTWLPPGRLVEHLQKTITNKEKQASEQTNKQTNLETDMQTNLPSKQITNKGQNNETRRRNAKNQA